VRRHFGTLLVIVALASLGLGTAGFLACDPATGFATAFYRSVQLFYWNYFPWNTTLEARIPWTLELARWLAPLTTLGALSRVAIALFHRRWEAYRARKMSGHTVICGAGEKGATLARDMRKTGEGPVILIEQNEDLADELADERFLVIRGDATKADVLRQAAVPAAGRLVVATGNDHDNLAIAMTALHIGGDSLSIHAHSRSASLCDLYRRNHAMTSAREGSPDIRVFNSFRNAARRAIRDFPPGPAGDGAHVVLPDLSHPAAALAVEYALVGHFAGGRRIHLHIIGPEAGRELAAFRTRYPALHECAEVSAVDFPPAEHFSTRVSALAGQLSAETNITVFPGFDGDHEAFSHALELLERTRNSTGLMVLLPGSTGRSMREMIGANPGFAGRIGFLPTPESTCGFEAVVGEALDRTARAIHENWLQETRHQIDAARAAGNVDLVRRHAEKATFKPWEALSEEQKGASRSQADHIPFKIRAAGLDPLTVTSADWAKLTDAQVESLARMEHARWAAYYWMTGWTFAPERNDGLRQHPDLISYDELDEPTKDYDRAAVRNLAQYLA